MGGGVLIIGVGVRGEPQSLEARHKMIEKGEGRGSPLTEQHPSDCQRALHSPSPNCIPDSFPTQQLRGLPRRRPRPAVLCPALQRGPGASCRLTHSDSSALSAPPLSTRRRCRAPARPPPRCEGREPLPLPPPPPPPPALPLPLPPPRAGEPPLSEPEAPDSSSSVSCEARCRRRSAILRRTAVAVQFLPDAPRPPQGLPGNWPSARPSMLHGPPPRPAPLGAWLWLRAWSEAGPRPLRHVCGRAALRQAITSWTSRAAQPGGLLTRASGCVFSLWVSF